VFPTFENYAEQFRIFAEQIPESGTLVYYSGDAKVKEISESKTMRCKKISYTIPNHKIEDGITFLMHREKIPLRVFGEHNLQNLEGARKICNLLGVSDYNFNHSISTFSGAANRLQLVRQNESASVYKDFAHSPSKLAATINAVKKQFPERKLVACIELHTFSSLSKNFLSEYNGTMSSADVPLVYFNPHTVQHKKLEAFDEKIIADSFADKRIKVFNDALELINYLTRQEWEGSNLLMMSSGNFDGMSIEKLAEEILD
jgi:UDP-N-acetylmuramate: L-alanyl-gamma-D-glutamyl-meso-diaminopimelate ligase